MKTDKKLVMIEWEDACCSISKDLPEVLKDSCLVQTYGILVHMDKKHHVVMTHSGGPESSDHMKIPTSLVREIKELKPIKFRKGKK